MILIFNLVLIFIVLLIAYWWANQGMFSALLHLICVIVAGAIALALWEPITMGLLRGNAFDDYAWGVTLVGTFAIALIVLRVIMDKTVRGNVNVPTWANFAFGFPLGLAAGVLTAGMLMIGLGFIQSHQEIMGYSGYGRAARTSEVTRIGGAVWVPVHKWTNDFYNTLSAGSLYPTFNRTPLIHYNPELYKQASLVRDSFEQGRASCRCCRLLPVLMVRG